MRIAGVAVLLGLLGLSACATLDEPQYDVVTIDTDPRGAVCTVTREGELIRALKTTPASFRIGKSMHPMRITCEKPDFRPITVSIEPAFVGTHAGNAYMGTFVGSVVDAFSGAYYAYPENVTFRMKPVPRKPLPPGTPLPPPVTDGR